MKAFTKKEKSMLEMMIENKIAELYACEDEEKSESILSELERMIEIYEKYEKEKRIKIDPNTVIAGAVNLVGIVAILQHEKLNVITSKAMNFVAKGKIR